ncbi:Rap1a/Tai family immunity protein [Massilia rhizosphaerae]|uniref:Rap1a/Tai family immunity protein n=1 Tax=Massilia rhizosphaerae TaxID=2784389 RepID=UPI0018DB9C79|nr:Rap1a/Tai family immunity protein [Massilia rhizosphaerae]
MILVTAVPLHAAAQHADVTPWMTGERLVKLLGNVDPATLHSAPTSPFRTRAIAAEYRDLTNGEFVHGYIQAVHDATEGKEWCWSDKYQPHPDELEADARQALQLMSDTQLKRNAAVLIAEVWRNKWPCPATKRRDR